MIVKVLKMDLQEVHLGLKITNYRNDTWFEVGCFDKGWKVRGYGISVQIYGLGDVSKIEEG